MGVFSFLNRVARGDDKAGGGVFGFLNNVRQFGPETLREDTLPKARDIGVGIARGVARIPETLARSALQAGPAGGASRIAQKRLQELRAQLDGLPDFDPRKARLQRAVEDLQGRASLDSGEITDPIRRFAYGSEPIQTYQTRSAGIEKATGIPAPIAGIGLLGLDVTPGGKGAKTAAEQIIKATTAKQVEKVLAGKLPKEVIDQVSPALARTKDPNVIQNILDQAQGLPPSTRVVPKTQEPTISELGGARPNNEIQTAIEKAHNAGDDATAAKLIDQLPVEDQAAMRSALGIKPEPKIADVTPPGQKQRKFLETAQKADVLSSETKQAISDIRPQTYTPKSNPALYSKAKEIVDTNPELAAERVRRPSPSEATFDEDVAISTELLRRANAEGRSADAARIVDEMTEKGLQLGRGVQAYSLLGRLTPEGVLSLASRKIKKAGGEKLPPELAGKLKGMADKLKGLADDDPQKYRVIQDIGDEIAKHVPKSTAEKIWEVFGVPRSLLASSDISGMGRQGLALGTRFPKQFKTAFKDQVEYFGSENGFREGMARIAADPDYDLIANKMKVALQGASRKPEEQFSSTILEGELAKKLGVGHLVRASDRAYTGALTNFRHTVTKTILDDLRKAGIDPASLSSRELRDLGWYINVFSGRGGKPGGFLEKHGDILSKGLFSPQLWASRLRILDPTMALRLKGPARRLYIQNAGSLAAVMGTVLTLAAAAGAEVETDARSSDFLKIKVGDTRYDVLGGLQQNIVAAHRMLVGEKKSSQTGKVTKLRGEDKPYGGSTPFDVLFDLIENKESPLLATGSRLIRGEDRGGQPIDLKKEAVGLVVPLSIAETASGTVREGPAGAAKSLPNYLGIGTQTYGLRDLNLSKTQKTYVEDLKSSGAPKEQIQATERFYQTQKTSPDRDDASRRIKKALEANNLDEAVSIAKEYNKKYQEAFYDWADEYGEYLNDEQLVKDYQSKFITDRSFDRWIADINKGG